MNTQFTFLNIIITIIWLLILLITSYFAIIKYDNRITRKQSIVVALCIVGSFLILHITSYYTDGIILLIGLFILGFITRKRNLVKSVLGMLILLLILSLITGVIKYALVTFLPQNQQSTHLIDSSSNYTWRDPKNFKPILTLKHDLKYSVITDRNHPNEIKIDYQRGKIGQAIIEGLGGAPDIMAISISRSDDINYETGPQSIIEKRAKFGYLDTYTSEKIGDITFFQFSEDGNISPSPELYVFGNGYLLTIVITHNSPNPPDQTTVNIAREILATIVLKQ